MIEMTDGKWRARVVGPNGETLIDWVEVDQTDLFVTFRINQHAWHYFGVLCFLDLPGYFPQLEVKR